jgi:hypothetical protein
VYSLRNVKSRTARSRTSSAATLGRGITDMV